MTSTDYDIEQFFRALADRTRLRVIHVLGDEEVCVCSVVEALQTTQPKVSRHLAYLRRAGLVSARRDGKWMHYRIVEPTDVYAAEIFRGLRKCLGDNVEMRRDRERLMQLANQSHSTALEKTQAAEGT